MKPPFIQEISEKIWREKYRAGPDEHDIEQSWHRVAHAVASVEPENSSEWATRFLELMRGFRFLPGGRILAGAGTDREVTLLNCFVMGPIDDSMEGIFDALKEAALTMQQGGGVGYDFSTLRPSGTVARSSGTIASGPVSFMKIWDAMCATLLSTGSRRGAMMASLSCSHPDIETFVTAKYDAQALRHFNLSVQITDDFMRAVEADAAWPLRFEDKTLRRVPARELWQKILRAAYDTAEPGVLFVDQINRENNLAYQEHITTTNPCGEVPLPPYGACDLGSLNLPCFVHDAFEQNARLDSDALMQATMLAVRFLDNVIDLSRFPLPEQADRAHHTRRIGLGITGLADALIMLGHRYDSDAARETARDIMKTVCRTAYRASTALAAEKGSFPDLNTNAYLQSPFIRRLPADTRDAIANHGIRNSHLLAIAPAGTISLLANNISSGIEPVFAARTRRTVIDSNSRPHEYELADHALQLWAMRNPSEPLPPAFTTAWDIEPEAQLKMQATLQVFVDNAISKTINVSPDYSQNEFEQLYHRAHRLRLKGCTVFRPNPVTGSILKPEGQSSEPAPVHCCDVHREAD